MKDSQWMIAVGALAGVVFIIVFAGQYLGGSPGGSAAPSGPSSAVSDLELTFISKEAPAEEGKPVELEEKGHGEAFFFFTNANDKPVKVGLNRTSCRCTEAELVFGTGSASAGGPKVLSGKQPVKHAILDKAGERHELKKDKEAVTVPAGGWGWVRLGWSAEQPGPQALDATLWMEDPNAGKRATLIIRTFAHPIFRAESAVDFGTVTEADLAKGATRNLIVWSGTRSTFPIEVRLESVRGNDRSEPVEVGKAVELTAEQRKELDAGGRHGPGAVAGGWRVPLTLRPIAADGKTPLDIGPFKRTVTVTSADAPGQPRTVALSGRVKGVVEIGNDDKGGEVTLGSFSRKRGKSETINLLSDQPGLTLSVDAERTSKYLEATVDAPQDVGGARKLWKLKLTVKPGAASGTFPRKDDPGYADSAIYLTGRAAGQPPRAVRIAVYGTAVE